MPCENGSKEVYLSNPWFLNLSLSSLGGIDSLELMFGSSRSDSILDLDLLLLPDKTLESLSSRGLGDTPEEIESRFLGIRRLVIFGSDFFGTK